MNRSSSDSGGFSDRTFLGDGLIFNALLGLGVLLQVLLRRDGSVPERIDEIVRRRSRPYSSSMFMSSLRDLAIRSSKSASSARACMMKLPTVI
jgi:hypothetical protein